MQQFLGAGGIGGYYGARIHDAGGDVEQDVREKLLAANRLAARYYAEVLQKAIASFPRQALHAAALAFRHPASGEPLDFHSEWPSDLRPALLALGAEDLVARPDPLGYLLFFNRDG